MIDLLSLKLHVIMRRQIHIAIMICMDEYFSNVARTYVYTLLVYIALPRLFLNCLKNAKICHSVLCLNYLKSGKCRSIVST